MSGSKDQDTCTFSSSVLCTVHNGCRECIKAALVCHTQWIINCHSMSLPITKKSKCGFTSLQHPTCIFLKYFFQRLEELLTQLFNKGGKKCCDYNYYHKQCYVSITLCVENKSVAVLNCGQTPHFCCRSCRLCSALCRPSRSFIIFFMWSFE